MRTLHEGSRTYEKHWNWWIRSDGVVDTRDDLYFPDFESEDRDVLALVRDVMPRREPIRTEREIWERIGVVWAWMRDHVDDRPSCCGTDTREGWPTLADLARDWGTDGRLVARSESSRAHLLATLLGRSIGASDRVVIAWARRASHDSPAAYVGVYVAGRWFYLDPNHAEEHELPDYDGRHSLGSSERGAIDYEHPYEIVRLPDATIEYVPHLPR